MILITCPFHALVDSINPKQKADEEGDNPNAGDCKLPPNCKVYWHLLCLRPDAHNQVVIHQILPAALGKREVSMNLFHTVSWCREHRVTT
jgi:hypothetical protein